MQSEYHASALFMLMMHSGPHSTVRRILIMTRSSRIASTLGSLATLAISGTNEPSDVQTAMQVKSSRRKGQGSKGLVFRDAGSTCSSTGFASLSAASACELANLIEIFGAIFDREVVQDTFSACDGSFERTLSQLQDMTAPGASSSSQLVQALETDTLQASDLFPWELLSCDMQDVVLAMLGTRDLARVAITCRDWAARVSRSRINARNIVVPMGLSASAVQGMVAGHINATSVSLHQWAQTPLWGEDFNMVCTAISRGSRSTRRAVQLKSISLRGCGWLTDANVEKICTLQHLEEVDFTGCHDLGDASLASLAIYTRYPTSTLASATPPQPAFSLVPARPDNSASSSSGCNTTNVQSVIKQGTCSSGASGSGTSGSRSSGSESSGSGASGSGASGSGAGGSGAGGSGAGGSGSSGSRSGGSGASSGSNSHFSGQTVSPLPVSDTQTSGSCWSGPNRSIDAPTEPHAYIEADSSCSAPQVLDSAPPGPSTTGPMGLTSINLSGCRGISADGVRALLNSPITKACLLRLDVSRCMRITRQALQFTPTCALQYLRASDCGNLRDFVLQLPRTSALRELHLNNCKQLKSLLVVAPSLTQLHMGGCPNLTQVNVRCQRLCTLAAPLCTRLGELEFEAWDCPSITKLNLFGCRQVSTACLQEVVRQASATLLTMDINGCTSVADLQMTGALALTTLDVSGCKSLVTLQCDSPCLALVKARVCPTLRLVRLASPALQTLDITHCPNLTLVELQVLQPLNQYVGGASLEGAALAAAATAAVVATANHGGVAKQGQQLEAGASGGVAVAAVAGRGGRGLGALQVRVFGSEQLLVGFLSQVYALRAARKSVAAAFA